MMRAAPVLTRLVGAKLPDPRWHILRVMSGTEARQRDRLALAGVHVAYPVKTIAWRDAHGQRREREAADVAGWIFAKFRHAPMWHELRARRIITGMLCRETPWGPVPYAATEDDVRVWMGLPTVAEEIEAARREALRVRPGDAAQVLIGDAMPLAVIVTAVRDGRVWWECGPLKGETAEDRCARMVG